MSGTLTLKELRERNKQEEEGSPEPEPEPQPQPEPEPADEPDGEPEGEERAPEPWMQSDEGEEDPPKGNLIDARHAKNLRLKLRGKAEEVREKDAELAKLRDEVEKLKKAPKAPAKPQAAEPKRADFKTDLEYLEARQDWKDSVRAAESQSQQHAQDIEQRTEAQKRKVEEKVEAHYTRAVDLCEKSGIEHDRYNAADTRVRIALEQRFPGAGDTVMDNLIARMGEGSERVVYNLGVNSKRLQELVDAFEEDHTGLAAAVYLGKLNTELSPPKKRQSNAPQPPGRIQGDRGTGSEGAKAKQLKQKYNEAHRKGDGQTAFRVKREAKKAGINVADW